MKHLSVVCSSSRDTFSGQTTGLKRTNDVSGCPSNAGTVTYRLERYASPHRRLREYHRHGLASKGFEAAAAASQLLLALKARLQHCPQLVLGEVIDVQKMMPSLGWRYALA